MEGGLRTSRVCCVSTLACAVEGSSLECVTIYISCKIKPRGKPSAYKLEFDSISFFFFE